MTRSKDGEILKIANIRTLRITKIKDWAIYFDCDGRKYLLHRSDDCETVTTLYERRLKENGRYDLICMSSRYLDHIPSINYRKNKRVLRYIDIDKFIWDLTVSGFFESCYSEDIKMLKTKRDDINRQILELRKRHSALLNYYQTQK